MAVGIIYATGSKAIRRIIVPDVDSALKDGTNKVSSGETMLVSSGASDLASCMAAVQQATGQVSPYPRCVVIDQANKVIDYAMADPALDTHPLGALVMVSVDGIAVGATFDPLTRMFTNPLGQVFRNAVIGSTDIIVG